MPLALLIAPTDPRAGDAASRREALAWLRGQLARYGFDVVIAGSGKDPLEAIERAAPTINGGDSVLVHVSGRFMGRDSLGFAADRGVSLERLGETFASRLPADLSFMMELTYEDDPKNPIVPHTVLACAIQALGAGRRGHAVLAVVRRSSQPAGRIDFTKAVLGPPVEGALPPPAEAVLAAMHRRAMGAPENRAAADGFLFVRGKSSDAEASEQRPQARGPVNRSWPVSRSWNESPTDRAPPAHQRAAAAATPVLTRAPEPDGVEPLATAGGVPDPFDAAAADPGGPGAFFRAAAGSLDSVEPVTDPQARVAEPGLDAQRATADGAADADSAALDEIDAATAAAPLNAAPYAAAFELYRARGHLDAALLAAMALEDLGAARAEHRLMLDRFRSVVPVRARASLDSAAWAYLRAPGFDEALAALFAAIERAAVAVKIDELRETRRLPVIDRNARLSETSTASVVRSFQWAARFLGLVCPDLYAIEEAPGVAVMYSDHPSSALGRAVLSGRSAKDLAFLAGCHLTYYRPEHHVLLYYPTRELLTELLYAAVQLGMPQNAAAVPPGVQSLRARLAPRMGETALAALAQVVRVLDARGGQAKVGAWMRCIELTAARVGLFLCGDLATAAGFVRAESQASAELSIAERRGDLAVFCSSRAHAALRARFVALDGAEPSAPPSGGERRAAS